MKTKPNEPITTTNNIWHEFENNNRLTRDGGGLTKREYFAAMAMQGFLSMPLDRWMAVQNVSPEGYTWAQAALIASDALIAELNKINDVRE